MCLVMFFYIEEIGSLVVFFLLYFFIAILWVECRTLYILDKCFTTELYPQP